MRRCLPWQRLRAFFRRRPCRDSPLAGRRSSNLENRLTGGGWAPAGYTTPDPDCAVVSNAWSHSPVSKPKQWYLNEICQTRVPREISGRLTREDGQPTTQGRSNNMKNSLNLALAALAALMSTTVARADYSYSNAVISLAPVAYWPLNETNQPPAPGNLASNLGTAGFAYDGYYGFGIGTGITGALVGDPDAAASFNGSSGYMDIPAGLPLRAFRPRLPSKRGSMRREILQAPFVLCPPGSLAVHGRGGSSITLAPVGALGCTI